jgi:hypothetical protein
VPSISPQRSLADLAKRPGVSASKAGSSRKRFSLALLCAAGIIVSALTFGPALRLTLHGVTDFMPLYIAGKLAFSSDLYNSAQVLKLETESGGWSSTTRLCNRLPYVGLLLWPLAQLHYSLASAIWEILCVGTLAGFAMLWPHKRRWAVALACCWSLPAFMTVAEGQDIGFLLVWIALAVMLLQRGRPGGAGLVTSLCAAKFHLFLMLPLWIIGKKQWRFASGAAAGGGILLALSFLAGGLDWPARYYRFLKEPANNPYPDVMPNLHGLFANQAHGSLLEIGGIAAIAAAVWITVRHANPEYEIAAVLAGGVLAAPHAYMADCALLIPAALVVLAETESAWTRAWAVFLLLPVPYVCLLLGVAWPIRGALVIFVLTLAWEAWRRRVSAKEGSSRATDRGHVPSAAKFTPA